MDKTTSFLADSDDGSGGSTPLSPEPSSVLLLKESEFQDFLRMLTEKRGQVSELARKLGIDNSELSKVIRGKQAPGPKLLEAMKVKSYRVYEVAIENGNGSEPGS